MVAEGADKAGLVADFRFEQAMAIHLGVVVGTVLAEAYSLRI